MLALVAFAGCAAEHGALTAQEVRLGAEQSQQLAELDRVEARLVEAAALRSHWEVLGERHGQVSQVACESAAGHVAAMLKHEEKQQKKRAKLRRLARAAVGAGDTHVSAVGSLARSSRAHNAR